MAPGEGAPVSALVLGLAGGASCRPQNGEKLFKASRASLLLAGHRNDC